ncbi:2-succinyl-5-enolpyruvyl-6-hydroxy-3-cyclohexene-1-carboxylic-acid synthase [Radiobacillus kanasensis]|uniref:2-succinyl-5-enolpyruvyl-6-hydroxy-3- cyclohexene-1-carboxylic-acid synthase n=1 Tax=Radiobacillus kanasensis TaxID=2844358 RepID=UPI001E2D97EA|nr:2-succinyl-5-enolpyruvyl-6-hydroxy-3-cyclohexene-1-carboxylic-acid synthase [Radiobacillus kanasensis]UFT98182.1 2-succinyl-5-enolpyruvyl-6-hydroxy-3-cyclohexene-1-carboxylic-acid synthase [Radiobacillus kanasensis]
MDHTETLTRYVTSFVDELYHSGLRNVVISPGSRSTPLALTFAEHTDIKHWVNMDERSAAYFALGMAKQTKRPVALLCTSGTAAANYYPAIVEAHYSRVPLLVLTADRPHELRDVGAPQAIDQIDMFRNYVKWFHEMALPEGTPAVLNYARSKASRAYAVALEGNAGPVHLNFPFREPLVPDFTLFSLWQDRSEAYHVHSVGKKVLNEAQVESIVKRLSNYSNGLIVVGPQEDPELAEAVVTLAQKWKLPILADPLSQLRAGPHPKDVVIETYDSILKSEKVRAHLQPEFILRFGAMPVSKPYLLLLKEFSEIDYYVVEAHEGYREPAGKETTFIYSDPVALSLELTKKDVSFKSEWLHKWVTSNEKTREILMKETTTELTEGHVVKYLIEAVPDSSTIYVGNSMPVRDLDSFLMSTSKSLTVLGNRGANGIDGITSSALGAAASGQKVTLLIGDISFYHDFNGLLVGKQYGIDITIVVINNNGGGIFSFLPQANQADHFEVLFGTPLDMSIQDMVALYDGNYVKPATWKEVQSAIEESHKTKGLSVIEIGTDRNENVIWHRQKWQEIEAELLSYFKG